MKRFVKSADTKTAASQSQANLERILRRYGAGQFSSSADYEQHLIRVGFRVPDTPGGPPVPVRLEISIEAVARALGYFNKGTPTEYGWAQAERVAWRHLVLWVDAACSAVSAGMQTMAEAFFAHVLTRGTDGQVRRLVEQLGAASGDGNWRGLLAPPESRGNGL